MTLDTLVEQTRESRSERFRQNQQLHERLLREGQSPEILFIGCNDSRVMPEVVTPTVPGNLFVLRTIANIVPPYGVGEHAVGATVEFAIRHLKIERVIVCGHTDCGGIHALDVRLAHLGEPHLARWVEYARPAQTQVDARGVDADARHRAIVEQNVLLQLENLYTYAAVREALDAGALTSHGWVYDLKSGRVSFWDTRQHRFVDENDI